VVGDQRIVDGVSEQDFEMPKVDEEGSGNFASPSVKFGSLLSIAVACDHVSSESLHGDEAFEVVWVEHGYL
jgi:hypothetical protein